MFLDLIVVGSELLHCEGCPEPTLRIAEDQVSALNHCLDCCLRLHHDPCRSAIAGDAERLVWQAVRGYHCVLHLEGGIDQEVHCVWSLSSIVAPADCHKKAAEAIEFKIVSLMQCHDYELCKAKD